MLNTIHAPQFSLYLNSHVLKEIFMGPSQLRPQCGRNWN
jgi:hypothetical protein